MRKSHEDTIMVRLRRGDHARLVAMRDRMVAWAREHPDRCLPWLLDDEVSLSSMVRLLIYRQDCKDARSRASQRNRACKARKDRLHLYTPEE